MYLLPAVLGGGIVVGGGFVGGGFFVSEVESAAALVGALPPHPLNFIIGWCDFERCSFLAIIHPSRDEAALPCLASTPCIIWDFRSVFILEKAQRIIFCHLEPS